MDYPFGWIGQNSARNTGPAMTAVADLRARVHHAKKKWPGEDQ
jgi:hypothetical protein